MSVGVALAIVSMAYPWCVAPAKDAVMICPIAGQLDVLSCQKKNQPPLYVAGKVDRCDDVALCHVQVHA